MKTGRMTRIVLALAALVPMAARLDACAACFGKSDAAMAKGLNAGIFALLVFVLGLWVAFASFFVFIARRARATGEPVPGDTNDPQHN
jgi:heme/copper-type cytochrome/quinol oxidase subunit 2